MQHFHKSALSIAILVALSNPAIAETKNQNIVDLGKTVVTGQKIDRSRQDTVDSVKVFNSYELEERAKADDFYDLLNQTANVVQDRSDAFQIRGISSNGATNEDDGGSTIGLFLDDVIVGRRAGQDGALSLWDVEQVEILRGPQSTTSGRNSIAGAFVIKTKDPEFASSGRAKLGYGSHNTYQAAIAQTGAITDTLAYRVAVDHRHTDNFTTNTKFNKKDWDEESSTTLRAKLKYQADKNNSVLFSASHTAFDDKGDDAIDVNARPERQVTDNHLSTWETQSNNFSLKYDTRLSDKWKVTGTTTQGFTLFDRNSDADGPKGNSTLTQNTHETNTSQEVLFNYDGDKSKAAFGLYVSQGKLDDQYQISNFSFPLAGFKSQLPPKVLAGLNANKIDITKLNAKLFVDVASEESFRNAALFFNNDYKLSPQLTLISGLRVDHETRKNNISARGKRSETTKIPIIDGLVDKIIPKLGGIGNGKRSSTHVLPKLGLDYAWSNTLNTGIVVQRGYRPGGVSVNPVRGKATEYDAEFTTNYELSLRKQSADKKLKLNTNAYYTEWEDQQVRTEGNLGQFDITLENAAKSHLYGMELEGTYKVSNSVELNANLGYSKTSFDDFVFRGKDYKGNEFTRSRNWTGGVGANYRHPQGYFVNTQLNYADGGYNNIANTTKIDDFLLWNMKVGYETDAWRTDLYFKNLLNEEYVSERYARQGGIQQVVLGSPFTFGANLEFFW